MLEKFKMIDCSPAKTPIELNAKTELAHKKESLNPKWKSPKCPKYTIFSNR